MATLSPFVIKPAAESMDQVTELLWQDAMRHLGATNNEILLPINVGDLTGQSNVNRIKARLCALIRAPVVAFVDESIDALRIMRTPAFVGSASSVASHVVIPALNAPSHEGTTFKMVKDTEKLGTPPKAARVPRPPNAFILYRQYHHPMIKAAHPEFHNNDISVVLGKQWKEEPEHVKAHFRTLAEEIKRNHAAAHPNYQYSPRKPSEKKRRSTSRQVSGGQDGLLSLPQVTTSVHSAIMSPTEHSPMTTTAVQTFDSNMDNQSSNLFDADNIDYENIEFDDEEFESMIQRAEDAQDRALLFDHFTILPQDTVDTFDWADFLAEI